MKYNGIEFKSKMECHVYQWLKWCVKNQPKTFYSVAYEPEIFIFRKDRYVKGYKPDFRVITSRGIRYIEVKGFMDFLSDKKIKAFRREYPYKIRVIDRKDYKWIRDNYNGIIDFV